jgi:hypothetical protein
VSYKILCLHGFLGTPENFDFLKESYQIKALNLCDFVHLGFDELFEQLQNFGVFEGVDAILGYSFGARLGLRFKVLKQMRIPLFCIGGHLGLRESEDILKRKKFEDNMIKKICSFTEEEFLGYWNSLDLFSSDKPLNSINMKNADLFFKNYGLSSQEYLFDLLNTRKDIYFLYGGNDSKYSSYARTKLNGFELEIVPNVGHRALAHHDVIKDWIKDKL